MLTEFPKGRPPGPWPPDHGSGRQLPRGQVGAEERRDKCGDRERGQNKGPVLQRDVAEVVAAGPAPFSIEGDYPDDGRLQRQPQRDGAPSVGGGLSSVWWAAASSSSKVYTPTRPATKQPMPRKKTVHPQPRKTITFGEASCRCRGRGCGRRQLPLVVGDDRTIDSQRMGGDQHVIAADRRPGSAYATALTRGLLALQHQCAQLVLIQVPGKLAHFMLHARVRRHVLDSGLS